MAEQQLLFTFSEPTYPSHWTIDQRFEAFHQANPWVYTQLVALARYAVARGKTKLGIKSLIERLRWDFELSSNGQPWKLNNSFSSRYARKIMAECPDLTDVFELRALRAA